MNDIGISISNEVDRCPTCGQRVRIATTNEGTNYYVAVAEQEASLLAFYREHGSPDLTRMVEYEAKLAKEREQ